MSGIASSTENPSIVSTLSVAVNVEITFWSDFVLNEYGMPKRFPDGLYHVKKNPVEKVTLFKMKYLKQEVMNILSDRRKVVAATRIQSRALFD